MSILFINPNRSIERRNIWGIVNSVTPPLGLAMLSAVLARHGHASSILDASAEGLDIDSIISRIGSSVSVVGITATTPEMPAVMELSRKIKGARPDIKILLGGVHPTVLHEDLVRTGIGDMVVRGEGESAIVAIADGRSPADIAGLTWKTDGGTVVVNPDSATYADLDAMPFPAYDKLPMKLYRSALGAAKRSPSLGMITSRGCPGTCTFCYSGMFGKKIRFMSAERICEHIAYVIKTYGIREISFYDDTFTAHRGRIERLCELLLERNIRISWSCFARADTVDQPLIRLMKRAGCHQIGFGFESADEAVLKTINKRINVDKIERVVSLMKQERMDIRGAFMIGNVGETPESIERTLAYSIDLGIQYAVYNITTPFPGTELYRWATESNALAHTDWERYDLAHPVLMLPTVSAEYVQHAYRKAYRKFYIRPRYMLQRIAAIRSVHDLMIYINVFAGLLKMLFAKERRR